MLSAGIETVKHVAEFRGTKLGEWVWGILSRLGGQLG